MSYIWCEVTGKDWDRLNESEREIFITPICGSDKKRLTLAGRRGTLERMGIKCLRSINTLSE